MEKRQKAILAHPFWGRGGAEAAAMWTLEALTQVYDVTVYTRGGFDLASLNRLAGTAMKADDILVRYAPGATFPIGSFAHALFLRSLRSQGKDYDVRVTASGVINWGCPAIHFISGIAFNKQLARKFASGNVAAPFDVARKAVSAAAGLIARDFDQGGVSDIFVANSEWTRERAAPFCSGRMAVVYPPVPTMPRGLPWQDRENAVLVFGRIASEKKIETCIAIVEQARAEGADLALYIAGPRGEDAYLKKLEALFREKEWLEVLPMQTGDDKICLLGRLRYGLSACEVEAFGISTAEMSDAGMIVLVPRQSGQSEIAVDARLQFDTAKDASERLRVIDGDHAVQLHLHHSALERRGRFSTERYVTAVKRLASEISPQGTPVSSSPRKRVSGNSHETLLARLTE